MLTHFVSRKGFYDTEMKKKKEYAPHPPTHTQTQIANLTLLKRTCMCSAENLYNALFKPAQLFKWTCPNCSKNENADASAFCRGITPTGIHYMSHSFYIFCLFRMHSEMLILETAAAKGRPLVPCSLLPFWLWQCDSSCTTALELKVWVGVCAYTYIHK